MLVQSLDINTLKIVSKVFTQAYIHVILKKKNIIIIHIFIKFFSSRPYS